MDIKDTPETPTLIQENGTIMFIRPEDDKKGFTLEELYHHLKCDMVEIAKSQADGKVGAKRRNFILIIDEEGKLKNRPPNPRATEWFSSLTDIIVGPAILCHTKFFK